MKDKGQIIFLVVIIIILSIFIADIRITKLGNTRNGQVYLSLDTPSPRPIEFPETLQNNKSSLSFRGIDFYPFPLSYDDNKAVFALENLLQIKEINYVQIRFFLDQNNTKDSIVTYNKEQDIALGRMIELIHLAHKHVCLEVDFQFKDSNNYVANLDPQDISKWFHSYQEALIHYAIFAENNKVEMMSIGNEMRSMFKLNPYWQDTIAKVRMFYKGIITAKLNCWWQEKTFRQVLTWKWLQDLDYIGFSPYFDLTNHENPTVSELEEAWNHNREGLNIVSELATIANHFHKKLIFLEIGYRSINGTNIMPWNNKNILADSYYDPQEQALATQALFNTFRDKSWLVGIVWFHWPTKKPNNQDLSWAIWGKPVEQTITKNYSP